MTKNSYDESPKASNNINNSLSLNPKGYESISTRYVKNIDKINKNNSKNEENVPISFQNINLKFFNFENSKYSFKPHGIVRAYGANTNQGIVR